jgi:hypothetical protein
LGTNYNNIEACSVVLEFKTIPKMIRCIFVYTIIFGFFHGIRNVTMEEYKKLTGHLVGSSEGV